MTARRRRARRDDLVAIRVAQRTDGTTVYKPYVYDPSRSSGKRWLGTFTKLADAQHARDRARDRPRPGQSMPVADWIELFLELPEEDRGESTVRRYRYALRPVAAKFGRRHPDDVSPLEAKLWAASQPLQVSDVARTLWNSAIRHDVASRNPFANLRRKRSRGRRDITVLSEEEVNRLADLAHTTWGEHGVVVAGMVIVAAYSGIRPAELWALRWRDIDFRAGELRVEWQYRPASPQLAHEIIADAKRRGGHYSPAPGGLLVRPKNRQPRTIVLLDPAAQALAQVPRRIDTEFVFTTQRGTLFSKSKHHHYWSPVRAAFTASLTDEHWLRERIATRGPAGDLDFYELRHLCATMLLERGLSEADVALQLGHQDGGALVRSTYGHPSEAAARERIRAAMAPVPQHPRAGASQRDQLDRRP